MSNTKFLIRELNSIIKELTISKDSLIKDIGYIQKEITRLVEIKNSMEDQNGKG